MYERESGRVISNVGGWQSEDYRRFTHTPSIRIDSCYIVKESHNIASDLGIPEGERWIENLWININPKYSYNQVHTSRGKTIWCILCLCAENSGDICFTRSGGYALGTVAPNLY